MSQQTPVENRISVPPGPASSSVLQSGSPVSIRAFRLRTLKRAGLIGLAFLPFFAAVVAQAVPFRPTSPQILAAVNPLAFEQYLVNLGQVPPVREVGARYSFRNNGSTALRITQLEPSCGCLNPRLDKKDYAAGELGSFFLKVQTAGQKTGLNEFTVRVHYETQGNKDASWTKCEPIELAFKMLIPEKQVSVSPRALAFYQLSNGATSQDVVVTDERGVDLEIYDITTSTSLVTAERVGTSKDDGVVRHTLRIAVAGDVPPGRSRALVTIKTSDPNYRILQVPLLIQGRDSNSGMAASGWKVEPQQLSFPTNAGLLTPPQEFVVTGVAGQSLDLTRIAGESSVVSAKLVSQGIDGQGRPQARYKVQLTGIPGNHTFRDVISLRTTDKSNPLVQLPVVIGSGVQPTSGELPAGKPGPTLE